MQDFSHQQYHPKSCWNYITEKHIKTDLKIQTGQFLVDVHPKIGFLGTNISLTKAFLNRWFSSSQGWNMWSFLRDFSQLKSSRWFLFHGARWIGTTTTSANFTGIFEGQKEVRFDWNQNGKVLLMAEFLHQFKGSLYHYLYISTRKTRWWQLKHFL